MKTNELQIGDLVMYNPNVFIDDEYKPTKECYVQRISSGEDIDLAIEGCYYPIPLTAEILEKNGFVSKKGRFMQLGNFDNPPLILWHLVDEPILGHPKNQLEIHHGAESIHVSFMCHYVHELQHALRLCGLNDLADNFKV